MRSFAHVVLIAVLLLSSAVVTRAQDDTVEASIRQRIERLRVAQSLEIDGVPIAAVRFLAALYERRDCKPLWTDAATVESLLSAINASVENGLDPRDFHDACLERMRKTVFANPAAGSGSRADFDLLMTDALARLGYQLFWGKVDPESLDTSWNFTRPLLDDDAAALVERAVTTGDVAGLLDRLELKHVAYQRMKTVLRRYRTIAANGGWPDVPGGSPLAPGARDARVAELRKRLDAEGYTASASGSDGDTYDEALAEVVRTFQARHALAGDAVVGRNTLDELNVPVERRIQTIRVNMERARWVLRNVGEEFVLVNIAGFHAYVIRDRKLVWQTRSIVGKPYRKTPVFRGDMTYIELNPTWTVPPTILRQDMLPRLRSDPGYFGRNNFLILDSAGRSVSAATARAAAASGSFPYRIVQQPGPENALGRVKFMFPNRHSVYLHDTPSRELFAKTDRAFSSGCIRLEHPLDLAETLLADDPAWNRGRIDQVVASGKTTRVNLPRPVPVLLLYWTLAVEGDRARWYRDVYGRDARILAELNEPFSGVRRQATAIR